MAMDVVYHCASRTHSGVVSLAFPGALYIVYQNSPVSVASHVHMTNHCGDHCTGLLEDPHTSLIVSS